MRGCWRVDKLLAHISEEMSSHIVESIKPITDEENDKAWSMRNLTGEFTIKSTYHILRHKRGKVDRMNNIWIKDLLFKISFFLWRVWRKIIATDDNLKRIKI